MEINKDLLLSDCLRQNTEISFLWGAVQSRPLDWKKKEFRDENNHSVVTRIDLAGSSLLMTGDIEFAAIADLLALHGTRLDTNILKISHHGVRSGNDTKTGRNSCAKNRNIVQK